MCVTIGVVIIAQDAWRQHGQCRILRDRVDTIESCDRQLVAGGGRNCDQDGTGCCIAIGDVIAKDVIDGASAGRIGEGAVGLNCHRAVQRLKGGVDLRGQQIAIGIAVVDEHARRRHNQWVVVGHTIGICLWRGRAVDPLFTRLQHKDLAIGAAILGKDHAV